MLEVWKRSKEAVLFSYLAVSLACPWHHETLESPTDRWKDQHLAYRQPEELEDMQPQGALEEKQPQRLEEEQLERLNMFLLNIFYNLFCSINDLYQCILIKLTKNSQRFWNFWISSPIYLIVNSNMSCEFVFSELMQFKFLRLLIMNLRLFSLTLSLPGSIHSFNIKLKPHFRKYTTNFFDIRFRNQECIFLHLFPFVRSVLDHFKIPRSSVSETVPDKYMSLFDIKRNSLLSIGFLFRKGLIMYCIACVIHVVILRMEKITRHWGCTKGFSCLT